MIFIIYIFAFFFLILYSVWQKKKVLPIFQNRGILPGVPIIGNGLDCLRSSRTIYKICLHCAKTFKSSFGFFIFHIPYMVISTPEDIQIVNTKCLKKDYSFCLISELLGEGILTSNDEKWKRNRRIINPLFNLSVLSKSYLDVFNRQSFQFIQQLNLEANTENYLDLWPHIFKTSFSMILESAIGISENFNDDELFNMRQSLEQASTLIVKRICNPLLYPSFIFKIYAFLTGSSNIMKNYKKLPLKILEKAKQNVEQKNNNAFKNNNEKHSKTMIDVLLNVTDLEDQLTNDDISDEITTILFAGSETTAITIGFTLLMLAIREDIQDKVYAELYEVYGDSDKYPTLEDLSKLHFLEQCIKESLRRVSVAPLSIRTTNEDITLSDGFVIPSGMTVIPFYIGVHMNEKFYPEPYKWNPSNFDSEKIAGRPSASFCPFGYGPRLCVGYKYAMLAMKTQLALTLRNFKLFTDVKEKELDFDLNILIRSIVPFRIKLNYRHDKSLF